ncbi:hypothetical protein ASPWEDRAFT_40518 [Aspergillus wentii DTO 134E9]|uniref:Uncharacterized protein n=1 Tax=Aspergillus wentii DTO 134E9 TaxID=1073089 RepID=A0A1L9RK52_ASPWE|nr:uncharacterized protein ASPWEDRAFT_40518 [Aspergillus wentii DTO 134E9]OJJ35310.1 hypothetical protein ASPWEDRAFT_40518 [Aspergillus wentii DTO 134E9]
MATPQFAFDRRPVHALADCHDARYGFLEIFDILRVKVVCICCAWVVFVWVGIAGISGIQSETVFPFLSTDDWFLIVDRNVNSRNRFRVSKKV